MFGGKQRDLPAPERIVSYMDGERYAQLGVDPLLLHPATDFPGLPKTAAYIGSKPLMSWLAWAASGGGRASSIAWALIVLSVLSAGALVAALALLAARVGRDPLWACLAIGTPGVLAVLTAPGEGDLLATALVLLGLMWWMQARSARAAGVFVLAALARETMLVVPAALFLHRLLTARRVERRLLIPFAVYVGWFTYVRVRTGELPTASAAGSLRFVTGFADSISHWGAPEYLSGLLFVGLVGLAWVRLPTEWRLIVGLYAAMMLSFDTETGAFWWAFGRILLPAYLLTLVVLFPIGLRSDSRERGPHQAVP